MSLKGLLGRSTAALAGCALLALSLSPAEALTIPSAAIEQARAPSQVEHVWWRRWGGGHWGWGPGAVLGGLAAGALIGGAYAYGPYGYGPGYYGYGPGYYNGCWRRVPGPYGWRWANVC